MGAATGPVPATQAGPVPATTAGPMPATPEGSPPVPIAASPSLPQPPPSPPQQSLVKVKRIDVYCAAVGGKHGAPSHGPKRGVSHRPGVYAVLDAHDRGAGWQIGGAVARNIRSNPQHQDQINDPSSVARSAHGGMAQSRGISTWATDSLPWHPAPQRWKGGSRVCKGAFSQHKFRKRSAVSMAI